jgi:Trk-type K+ transport system membrane component
MPGIGASIVIFAVGAILDFGVTVSPYQHGFNIHTIGVILMIVGAVGFVLSLLFWGSGRGWYGGTRHRSVVNDSQGNFVQREDTFQ